MPAPPELLAAGFTGTAPRTPRRRSLPIPAAGSRLHRHLHGLARHQRIHLHGDE
jgi:hypothetical protein